MLLRKLRNDRRGFSTVIAVVLSLVILVVIVSNIVLWNYTMSQIDWERTKEDVRITNATRINGSSWSTAQAEYVVNLGRRLSGNYTDTKQADGSYETFVENAQSPNRLDINGSFLIDLSTYSLSVIKSVEVQMVYRANDTYERFYLKAYNWTSASYSDSGFNNTVGHVPALTWSTYAVNMTEWRSYVDAHGALLIKVQDNLPDANTTRIDMDLLGARVVASGTQLTFQNKGAVTTQLVSLWVDNATRHSRYDINLFINSGDTLLYVRNDVYLPTGALVKVVTARGNVAVYSAT